MLMVPRLEPGVTALGQRVVVVGGFDTDLMAGLDITKRVDVYDPATDSWSQLADAPVPFTHIQLASVGTTLYLLGGLAGQTYVARGDTFALDTTDPAAQWRTLAPMPAGIGAIGAHAGVASTVSSTKQSGSAVYVCPASPPSK